MALDTSFLYQCKFCKKRFTKERHFMAHECKEMIRSREIQTVVGQRAYILYKHWLEKQRRKPPPIETFVTSTYYTGFIKFATFCKETSISDPELYVELMVKRGISPALWTKDEPYSIYLEHIDKRADPYKQAEHTLECLAIVADKLGIQIDQVFDELRYGEMMDLINQRQLTPWILFCSSKFKQWVSKLDEYERTALMKAIGIGYWQMTFEKNPSVLADMKELVNGVGI
jgi:hypothetical protein